MPLYALGELTPTIAADAYVHPDAVVIGDVHIGSRASIWPCAVLRGDFGAILVGERTSVQDGTVLHTVRHHPTTIGDDCVVGHNAHLEGCVVQDRCLIGSGSVVLNRVRVGTGSMIGAQALVPEDLQIPAGSMALGVPARIRPLPHGAHRDWVATAVAEYQQNAERFATQLRRIEPDAAASPPAHSTDEETRP